MNKVTILSLALILSMGVNAQQSNPKLNLQLDKATTSVSPTLYGLMTEEINYS